MFLVGLTGGFLTGKSTLAKFLKNKGIAVVDVDKLYHRLLLKDVSLKKKLLKEFGKDILAKGKIARKKLRKKISNNPTFIKKLNKITHPYIIKEVKKKISFYKNRTKFLVIEASLLYEANLERIFDKIIVVSSFKKEQLKRAKKVGYLEKEALNLIENQLPLKIKKRKADIVVENNGTLKQLQNKAERVHKSIITSVSLKFPDPET